MLENPKLTNQWVQELFENGIFIDKLTQFMSQKPHNIQPSLDQKILAQVNAITQEISSMIMTAAQKDREQRFDLIAQQLTKLSAQIMNMKNVVFGCNEKIDLETMDYNKSKLELSSILEHDLAYDFRQVKSSIIEMQQRFNQWFGTKLLSQKFSAGDSLSESKLSSFITKKCSEQAQITEKKILKRFETTDLLTQRRFEQVTKTMNNVLEMLNEAHGKKNERIEAPQMQQIKIPSGNQPSLMRQSSLQNLKIKSFFNFGHK